MNTRKQVNGECARGRAKEVYMLAGLIYCGKCGAAMVGISGHGRDKIRRAYYVCGKKQRSKECDLKTIRKDTVEQMALSTIKDGFFSPEGKANLRKQFEVYLAERPKQFNAQVNHIKRELTGLDKKINNIVSAVEEGRASSSLLDRLKLFEDHREILRSQLQEFEAKEQNPVTIDEVEAMLQQAEEKLNNENDPKSVKQVIQTFVDRVTVNDDGAKVNLKINPPPNTEGGSYATGSPKEYPIVYETYHPRERFNRLLQRQK
jgi:site-specific DNA recombinase